MKSKVLYFFKKQINKIKESFNVNKDNQEKKLSKINLWRRFINFIHSLFRSNRKIEKNEAVIEKVAPKESKETISVHTSTVSIASSTVTAVSVPVVIPEVPPIPPSPSPSSSSSSSYFSVSSSLLLDSLDLDLDALTSENNKPLQVQVLPKSQQESDFIAPCSDTSNSKAEASKQAVDAEITKKIDDLCDSIEPIKAIEVIKARPKGPARRKPTARLLQARKTEAEEADNNQGAMPACSP